MPATLIIPGLKSSGPSHWQTWLEARVAGAVRVTQNDWTDARLPEWTGRVRSEIVRSSGPVYIVAHSFGALAAVQAGSDHAERIAGALLVAPADPEIFGVEDLLPRQPLSFPAIVVASTNDPWMPFEKAQLWAQRWGADLVNLGHAGHINAETGYGPWPEGIELLHRLQEAARYRASSQRIAAAGQTAPPRVQARRRSALSRFAKAGENRDLLRAAALLREAGWAVSEPPLRSVGAR